MGKWNISSDGTTLEPRQSPSSWLRQNSLRLAVVIGVVEALVAYIQGFHYLWIIALLVVIGYWWVRDKAPAVMRRPLWIVAMSQAVAGLLLPALVFGLFITAILGALLLLVLALVLLGDLRRT
jgi:hypothetical protein